MESGSVSGMKEKVDMRGREQRMKETPFLMKVCPSFEANSKSGNAILMYS